MWTYKEKYKHWIASNAESLDHSGSFHCPECKKPIEYSLWFWFVTDQLASGFSPYKIFVDVGFVRLAHAIHECGAKLALLDDFPGSTCKETLFKGDFEKIWNENYK